MIHLVYSRLRKLLERLLFSFQLVSDDDELSCLIKECLEETNTSDRPNKSS